MQTVTWQAYHAIYRDQSRHSIVGDLRLAQEVHSPELENQRDILVHLPRSYNRRQKRYPVLYMHDGYNLFDEATSYLGEWHVDETLDRLSREEGIEMIVVGIPNMGAQRLNEYSPFRDKRHGGGQGEKYLEFIVRTLKPIIDRDFRTRADVSATGIMGSSMGGLISLYAFFRYPQVFGFAGIMSPSLWIADGAIFRYVSQAARRRGRLYLDAGTREMGGGNAWPDALLLRSRSRHYYASVRRMKRILVKKGFRPQHDLLHIEERAAAHNEAAWARRLPEALRFFSDAR